MAAEQLNVAANDEKQWAWITGSGMLCNVVCSFMFGNKTAKAAAFLVDEAAIAAIKEEAKGVKCAKDQQPVAFVSTNDILTSHFGRACDVDVAMMAINFRGKVKNGATLDDAGNYEGAIPFDPDSFATPSDIRKTMVDGPPYVRAGQPSGQLSPLPGCCKTCCSVRPGLISNWAGEFFDGDLRLDGFEQLLHTPLYDASMFPFPAAVVFRPMPGQTAVLYLGLRDIPAADLQSNKAGRSPLGSAVSQAMFPC